MRFVQIGRRYFFGWQVLIPTASVGGEKRRYSRGYIEAFQRSQAELRGAKRRSAKLKRASQHSQILRCQTIVPEALLS